MKQHRFDKDFQLIQEAVDNIYNEAKILPPEERLAQFEDIVNSKSHKKIEGKTVDLYTASMIVKVAKALKDENRNKFLSLPLDKMVAMGWKLIK
jgi:hypothetical protein